MPEFLFNSPAKESIIKGLSLKSFPLVVRLTDLLISKKSGNPSKSESVLGMFALISPKFIEPSLL